ncbi:hypothetical protein AB0M20_20210 [Actinoplanes sp. NPDC051633]|uniref:hypothetical protein n=1 Tax=Actinoplanes sp. NPDC051633 TaxID=3155670 RepID=UPI003414F8A5
MRIGGSRVLRRSVSVGVAGILLAVLGACTGRGGGYLPPSVGFNGQASLGFSFSCEDKGGLNPPTGKLSIQLAYVEQGTYVFSSIAGQPFGIHGVVDVIDPVLESAICIGQNPPPDPANTLIFLGRYWPTSTAPVGFPTSCAKKESRTAPSCRFEVEVRDNDSNHIPSKGDFFAIQLSSTTAVTSEFDPATVFYARAGFLGGGNITVK